MCEVAQAAGKPFLRSHRLAPSRIVGRQPGEADSPKRQMMGLFKNAYI
jgi:hypothetical protein